MPQLGESVAEGTIGKWLKQPGDHVDKYEPLLEVITDKVNAEVPSPFEGILREILAEEGATVPNNAEIAVIETADDGATAAEAAGHRARCCHRGQPAAAPATGPAGSDERPGRQPPRPRPAPAAPAAARRAGRRRRRDRRQRRPRCPHDPGRPSSAPRARPERRTRSSGTGGGGRITRDDVLAVVETIRTGRRGPGARHGAAAAATPSEAPPPPRGGPAPAPAPARPSRSPPGADEVLLPMTQMRKGIAAQMTRALARPARVRPHGGRRHQPRQGPRARQARLPGPRGHLAQLRPVRHQGRGRRAAALPVVQRPLDRAGPPGQAADPHGRRGRRR